MRYINILSSKIKICHKTFKLQSLFHVKKKTRNIYMHDAKKNKVVRARNISFNVVSLKNYTFCGLLSKHRYKNFSR